MASLQTKLIKLSLKKTVKPSLTPYLKIEKLRKGDCHKPHKSSVKHCQIEEIEVKGISCTWIIPKEIDSDIIILYFHGGAYVCGPSQSHWSMLAHISKETKSRSILVNYSKSPESTYPSAIDDMENIYNYLRYEFEDKGIVFAGDSAGGGLALSLAMKLRDNKKKLPSKLILLSPWLDVSMENPDLHQVEKLDQMLALPGIIEAGKLYSGKEKQDNPYISPLYGKLDELPPTLLMVGTHELLLCDCRLLKEKAVDSNIDLTYQEWDEMFHVWQIFFSFLPEAKEAVREIIKYIQAE